MSGLTVDLDYRCNTSVAPQLLQTATVTIHHEELAESDDEDDMYELLPHLLVLSGETERNKSFCTAFLKDSDISKISRVYGDAVVSGVALEPIVDGRLAKHNPQSTAKTALAVGGVVSIAVPKGTTKGSYPLGHTVLFESTSPQCYARYKKRLVCVPIAVSTSIADAIQDIPRKVIGTVVDNSQVEEEGYIRVKLL